VQNQILELCSNKNKIKNRLNMGQDLSIQFSSAQPNIKRIAKKIKNHSLH
jgi:hypothetical protein